MRALLLSVAVVAWAGPVWGQLHVLPKAPVPCPNEGKFDEILAIGCLTTDTDNVVAVGQNIGQTWVSALTSPVSVLTTSEIRARNQAVVAELLRTIPGLAVSQNGGAGSLTQIRLRGSEANHVLVIIDGVEVANPTDGAFDFGGLRSDDIVKIEVLRGEQSALYGSDAIGGVINIITRAGETRESWRARFEAGSRGTFDASINAVIPLGNATLSIGGQGFGTDGYDIAGLGGETDGATSRGLNIGLNNVDLAGISFGGKFGTTRRRTDFDNDSDFDGRLNNTSDETTVDTDTARVDARFALAGFDHKITSHMVETTTNTQGSFSSLSRGARHGINWAAKRDFAKVHSFTALIEAEHEQYEITPNFTEPDAEPDNWAYAVAGDYRFNQDALTLTASARYDINDYFDDAATWRVGAGYGFAWDGRLRASIGTGIKNPTLIELFGFYPQSRFTGNRDLQPETSLGLSIGYDQTIGDIDFSIDYFRSELSDEITTIFNPDFTSTVANLTTDSTREGIELSARWHLADTIYLNGSASFLDSDQDGAEEIRRPDVLASVTATWMPSDVITLSVSADHNGNQIDTDFGTFSNVTLDSFTLVGANARVNLSDTVALTLRGSNLLDENYQEIVGYASPGRGVFGGLELTF